MSSLLYNGQTKKKAAGTTSYKRPGPPTPSKTAGRLSFGGLNDPNVPKSILKESCDNLPTSSKKSTPGKWGSMFASSRVKDEVWIQFFFLLFFSSSFIFVCKKFWKFYLFFLVVGRIFGQEF